MCIAMEITKQNFNYLCVVSAALTHKTGVRGGKVWREKEGEGERGKGGKRKVREEESERGGGRGR